jgi:hypothetical protein
MKSSLFLILIAPLICVTVTGQTIDAASRTIYGAITTITYASHIAGVKLDCVPSTGLTAGGGACTDNTIALNSVLATATAAHPVNLILDGGTSVTGIYGPAGGHWTLDCLDWNNGIFMASGSNAHVIRNVAGASAYSYTATPGIPGQNIAIRNCFVNGNRGNGTNGDSNSGNARQTTAGAWLFGVYLDNMAHVHIEHNWFYDEPSFNVLLNGCTDCIVENNRFDAVSQAVNQDGIHIDGPSSQIRVNNNWGNSSDDFIALNAPEGYGGPITDVAISNNHCVSCLALMLAYGGAYSGPGGSVVVSNVVASNNTVSVKTLNGVQGTCILLGFAFVPQGVTDVLKDFSISNTSCTTLDQNSGPILIADNIGTLQISNFDWISPSTNEPLPPANGKNPLIGFYVVDQSALTVSNLRINGAGIYRTTSGNAPTWLLTVPSAVILKRVEVDGFAVTNETGQSYAALPYLVDVQSGGAIGTFMLGGIDPALSPTLLNGNEWSRITNFYGPGISSYYRNTTYANLPPATYPGLKASISDSNAGGVWGAIEGGVSAGHYAEETSNGVNWTVTGK